MRWIAILVLAAGCTAHSRAAPEDPRQLLEDGRYARAESAAQLQFAEAARNGGEHTLAAAEALAAQAEAMRYGAQAESPAALELAERALALERELLPANDARLAVAILTLGQLHILRREYPAARALLEEGLAIRRKALGAEHPEVALLLIAIADLTFRETGELERALEPLEQARQIQDRALPPDHQDVGLRLSREAVFRFSSGEYLRSRTTYEQALAIQRKMLRPRHPRLAVTLYNLSIVVQALGDFSRARQLCQESLEIRRESLGPANPMLASNLRELADLHSSMGEYAAAQEQLEQALSLEEQSAGRESPSAIDFARQLAHAALMNGKTERARGLLERCEDFCRAHPDQGAALLTLVKYELGCLRLAENDFPGAESSCSAAQALCERATKVDAQLLVAILLLRADALQRSGAPQDACALLERAAPIQELATGSDGPALATVLESLASAHRALQQPEAALAEALHAEAIAREHLTETALHFEEEPLLRFAAARVSGLDVSIGIAASSASPEAAGQALDALIRSRALVLDLSIERVRSIHASRDPQVAALAGEFELAASRLSELLLRRARNGDSPQLREELEVARQAKATVEARLAESSADFRRDRARGAAGLDAVSAALPEASALVSYFRSRDESATWFAFVLRAGVARPALLALGSAATIDPLIAQVVGAEQRRAAEAESRAAGDGLRQRVWDPVARELGQAQRVFLVLDGNLAFVDFASLPVSAAGRERAYLIETAPLLHELTAERDLVARTETEPGGDGLLAVGGPDFDGPRADDGTPTEPGRTRGALRGLQFPPLPDAVQEAEEIAKLWPSTEPSPTTTVLTCGAATESAFKRLAPGRSILHLATHAYFLSEPGSAPAESGRLRGHGLPLATAGAPAALPQYQERSLVLAGLALAGANHCDGLRTDEDDGVLTSEEVACLDLSGTSWAVLSACDTGLGIAHSAEGVLGLRRAFLVAGARTVINSLWPVEDDLAREWMVALYRARLERKLGTAEALRAVGLEMLQRRRAANSSTEPASWAGFVAVGDWR